MNVSIILAAGEGTRMKSKISKVLHKVCGKPILEYVIEASKGASVEKNIVIVGNSGDMVRDYFKDDSIIFKTQPMGEGQPYGTGFAVMQALEHIEDDSTVLILCGDTPLITDSTINKLLNYHNENDFKGTVLTAILENPIGYGRIVRDNSGNILQIVEQKDASDEEKEINEINSGIFCFNGKVLRYALGKINDNNAQKEYYITDVIKVLTEEGHKLGATVISDPTEIHGVNSRSQLAYSEMIMRNRINNYHMSNGVTFINPENTYIEDNVKIGSDTIIYPGVNLEGNTEIGENCIIGSNSRIISSIISNGVEIDSSTIEESRVGENTHIGPYAHLRPNSNIGKGVKIGNFVEVKNSTIKDRTKAGHLTYIGDAEIGEDVNIGCGVVFVNYNGREKFRTTVGDHSFIGSNSNLVAPVNVHEWGYVAAGSTITKEVTEGTLSIARAHQKNIEGWVEKRGFKNHK